MKGTEKQVKWAEDIVNREISWIQNIESQVVKGVDGTPNQKELAIAKKYQEWALPQFEKLLTLDAAKIIDMRSQISGRALREYENFRIREINKEA